MLKFFTSSTFSIMHHSLFVTSHFLEKLKLPFDFHVKGLQQTGKSMEQCTF
jgi:hypothetical protein